jgi:hypothetical protein
VVAPAEPFRSGRRLATILRALLLVAIVVAGVDAAANVNEAQLIGRLQADADSVGLADFEASDLRNTLAPSLLAPLIITALGFLIAWTSRLYRNLRALGVDELRYTEGWAIGAWFIPFFNLVGPKQILNDIWRGSGLVAGDGGGWRRRPATPLLHWWWGVFILSSMLLFGRGEDEKGLEAFRSAAVDAVVSDVVFVVAAVLTIIVVSRLTDRQDRAANSDARVRRHLWVPAALLAPGLAVAVFGLSFAAFTAVDESGRAAAASTPDRRTVLAVDMDPGDCIDLPSGNPLPAEGESIIALDVVDCGTPHVAEVIARVVHPAGRSADYPGDVALNEHAELGCINEFEQSVGRSYAESELELNYLMPEARGWAEGDRTTLCIAALPEGAPLVGTVRDSGR